VPSAAAATPSPGQRFQISDLCAVLETYLDPKDVADVYRAYLFGAEAHEGQIRVGGEPSSTTPSKSPASSRACISTPRASPPRSCTM
jgi:(p)ppGpp synthase/HD superfamily hydrolase